MLILEIAAGIILGLAAWSLLNRYGIELVGRTLLLLRWLAFLSAMGLIVIVLASGFYLSYRLRSRVPLYVEALIIIPLSLAFAFYQDRQDNKKKAGAGRAESDEGS